MLDKNKSNLEGSANKGIFWGAQGLVFMKLHRGAVFGVCGEVGSGFIMRRLSKDNWSGPSALTCYGAGLGIQFGINKTYSVTVLPSQDDVNTFLDRSQIRIGEHISATLGSGREITGSAGISSHDFNSMFSYSKTKGYYVGVSLNSKVFRAHNKANRKFYTNYGWNESCARMSPRHILQGVIDPPHGNLHYRDIVQIMESRGNKAKVKSAENGPYSSEDEYKSMVDNEASYPQNHAAVYHPPAINMGICDKQFLKFQKGKKTKYREQTKTDEEYASLFNNTCDDYDDTFYMREMTPKDEPPFVQYCSNVANQSMSPKPEQQILTKEKNTLKLKTIKKKATVLPPPIWAKENKIFCSTTSEKKKEEPLPNLIDLNAFKNRVVYPPPTPFVSSLKVHAYLPPIYQPPTPPAICHFTPSPPPIYDSPTASTLVEDENIISEHVAPPPPPDFSNEGMF